MVLMETKITQKEQRRIQRPFILDLTAFFAIVKDDILRILEEIEKSGGTPDDAIRKIEALLGGDQSESIKTKE